MIKLKGILKENSALGVLPSSKLMKMKWNPLTESEPMNEEYVETIDGDGDIGAEKVEARSNDRTSGHKASKERADQLYC